jgi:hypothetical protein
MWREDPTRRNHRLTLALCEGVARRWKNAPDSQPPNFPVPRHQNTFRPRNFSIYSLGFRTGNIRLLYSPFS